MSYENARLEPHPTAFQRTRLEQWLAGLRRLCNQYGFVIDTEDGETRIVDLHSGHSVGIGLAYVIDDTNPADLRITAYDCAGSILDGVWLVDGPDGLIEQRLIEGWRTQPL